MVGSSGKLWEAAFGFRLFWLLVPDLSEKHRFVVQWWPPACQPQFRCPAKQPVSSRLQKQRTKLRGHTKDKAIMQSSNQHDNHVFLPEIWRVIAGHLGMRSWARVAGICKATWHLQLDPILTEQGLAEVGIEGKYVEVFTICRLLPAILSLGTLQTLALTQSTIGKKDAQSSIWASSIASEAMKSFKLLSCDDGINSEEQIPQWLLRPCDLDTLVISLHTFGNRLDRAIPP
ncbi:g5700 [Coccomyxa elongata]